MWQRVERLIRGTVQNKVDRETHFNNEFDQLVVEPGEALVSVYNRFAQLMNDLEQNGIKFPRVTVNIKFLNCLQPKWLKYVTQVCLAKRLTKDSYDDLFDYLSQYEKLVNASREKKLEKSHDPLALVAHTGSSSRITSPYYVTHPSSVADYDDDYEGDAFQNNSEDPLIFAMITLRTTSSRSAANVQCYNYSEKVTLTDEQNDFLIDDATRMEEIVELSANICLMARIQPANIDSDEGPSYDSAFLSEVQKPSTSYENPLFAKDNQEQKYPKQPKIINNTLGDDQIDSNIIFDEPNVDVNSGSVEYDSNVQASYELEQLARNAYKEAEKQQINANKVKQQNKVLTQQLDLYKEKIRVFEMTKLDKETFFNEFIKADRKARRIEKDLRNQFIRDRDIIQDLEQQRDKLQLSVVELKRQNTEDILDDATKSQKKMENKLNDPVAIEKKQNFHPIDYNKLNALYEDFVSQKELSAEQKYFSSPFIPSENSSNASTSTSSSKTKPSVDSMLKVRAQNQDLLITISELNSKLKNVEKGKSVNTKFDKTNVSNQLLCVTPLNKQVFQKKTIVPKTEEKHVLSKTITLQTSPNKKKDVETNQNIIAPGMYNVTKQQEPNTKRSKSVLPSTRLSAVSSVRRPLNRDSPWKNSVLSNTKKSSEKIEVSVRTNKKTYVASKNVVSNKKIVNDVDVVQIVMWIVDSGCSKHMTGDRSLLKNFVEKFMGTVRFGNDYFAAITGYGDYVQGNITVCHVYYVEGLGHNLFSVGQFCDGELEVGFCSNTCYVQNLEGDDLLIGARESNLYTISILDMAASSPVCLLSRATSTKLWLWHCRLLHLNFGTLTNLTKHDLVDGLPKFKYSKDHLCSACERGKSKKSSHPPKLVPSTHSKLELLHMDLCGPMRVATIHGMKYILVIVDDYSRFTWVYFLHTKDETPEIIKKFIPQVQLNYNAKVHKIRTDNVTKFKNITLKDHYEKLGIMQQFLNARTPQQNGVVERRNHTLVEVARTMLIFSRLPEFLWAEAISTACFTQNRPITHTRYNKTPYELLHGRKPNVKYFHSFGSLCYPTNDQEDIGKMKPKADIGIFIGYLETSRGFQIYNHQTKKIMETIHVKFDELTTMASERDSLEPVSQQFIHDDSSAESMNTPSKEDLDNLFKPMYEEYFEKRSFEVSINSAAK
ncbi:retrovirus-related pol polyprotein from transposon TNT 1-94 [Tanacetum coccineum]